MKFTRDRSLSAPLKVVFKENMLYSPPILENDHIPFKELKKKKLLGKGTSGQVFKVVNFSFIKELQK